MADDDNFDIDIYGDDNQDFQQEQDPISDEAKQGGSTTESGMDGSRYGEPPNEPETEPRTEPDASHPTNPNAGDGSHNYMDSSNQQQITSTGGSSTDQVQAPKQAPTQQGVKRKEGGDDRETDPGATSAVRLGELQWWVTEDDIRGWANQCGCEDELKDVTFNEHKVNGKSKGEAFVELQSPQAATALKRRIESFGNGQTYAKKATAIYVRPDFNPFKTYPKDAPARNKDGFKDRGAPGAYNNGNPNFNQHGGGFRGGRGNFNNNNSRGGMGGMNNVNTGGFGGQGRGGFQNTQMGMMGYGAGAGGMGGNFGNQMMGGFGNQMGFNRGGAGMMNMRGGFNNRGRGNMMGGNMMPNMAMGAMGMPMNAMGMGMQGGFGGNAQGHFNPQFFGGNSPPAMSPGVGNPHGAKRPRPE